MKHILLATALSLPCLMYAAPKVLPVLNTAIDNIQVNANQAPSKIDLNSTFDTEEIDDNVVRFTSQTSNGGLVMDFALFSNRTPLTRVNFLNYVTSNRYDQSFIHRSMPGFVIQGGGFFNSAPESGLVVSPIPTDPAVTNEQGVSNTYSTISMAKTGGDPNSATSQWFVSLGDNSENLDNQNGGFTVFGRVTKSTMASAAAFGNPAQFPTWNAGSAFTNLPLNASFDNSADITDTDLILFPTVTTAPLPAGEAGESTTLAYSVTNSDPSVVTVEINDSDELVLTCPQDASGISQIKVSATDSVGNVVDDNFAVKVLQSYDVWRNVNFPAADASNDSISGPEVDSNQDGLTNLELYVHGLSVGKTHAEPVLASNISPSNFPTFTYPIQNNLTGFSVAIQQSNSLGIHDSWTTIPHTETSRITNGLRDTVTIRANSTATSTDTYYRLVFTLTD